MSTTAIVLGFIAVMLIMAFMFAISLPKPDAASKSPGLLGVFGAIAPFLAL